MIEIERTHWRTVSWLVLLHSAKCQTFPENWTQHHLRNSLRTEIKCVCVCVCVINWESVLMRGRGRENRVYSICEGKRERDCMCVWVRGREVMPEKQWSCKRDKSVERERYSCLMSIRVNYWPPAVLRLLLLLLRRLPSLLILYFQTLFCLSKLPAKNVLFLIWLLDLRCQFIKLT